MIISVFKTYMFTQVGSVKFNAYRSSPGAVDSSPLKPNVIKVTSLTTVVKT